MLKSLIRKLPGIRGLVAERDRLQAEVSRWEAGQSFPPGHYYSPVPDYDEVRGISQQTGNRDTTQVVGIDLGWDRQQELFRSLAKFYPSLPFGNTQETRGEHRYYYENGFYSYTDGIILSCLLQHLRPKRLIEVGSGFSSCMTLDTNDLFLDRQLDCTFIEPYPERLKENLRAGDDQQVTIIEDKVQNVGSDVFAVLEPNDILFIDSSHVGKAASDVNYLFFEILPTIAPGVWVHIHDVFYPFEYPEEWILSGRSWNEAYMIRCLLMFNHRFQIRMWGDALCAQHPQLVESLMPGCMKNTGAGIWLQRTDSAS